MYTAYCDSQNQLKMGARSFRIFPAGLFRSSDGSGRPQNIPGWVMDKQAAQAIIAAADARQSDYFIDYDHQSLTSSGQAPAAGWFKKLAWQGNGSAPGLYVTDARWTKEAFKMTRGGEYRYISPVFGYHPKTGRVERLVSIAITNNPALDGLTDLMAASASYVGGPVNESKMDELLRRMIECASPDNIRRALGKGYEGWVNGRPPPCAGIDQSDFNAMVQNLRNT